MKENRRQLLLAAVTPMLQEQEEIQLATFASVGSVSAKRKIATAAAAAVAQRRDADGLGAPAEMYVVLTSRRILFFDGHTAMGRPGKHLMTLPRDLVTVSAPKGKVLGLATEVELTIEGQDKNLKVVSRSQARRRASNSPTRCLQPPDSPRCRRLPSRKAAPAMCEPTAA